ncbi:MAG TPA: hypothetical protein VFG77_00865 [Nitrososphaeraceae archaeon]|nr:hypothetical protein [Nitrososphaeraceae archaeon]
MYHIEVYKRSYYERSENFIQVVSHIQMMVRSSKIMRNEFAPFATWLLDSTGQNIILVGKI